MFLWLKQFSYLDREMTFLVKVGSTMESNARNDAPITILRNAQKTKIEPWKHFFFQTI